MSKRLIYAEDAIDALDNIKIARNASWYPYYQQALTAVSKLPSAQPEIIFCKDCKHKPTLDEDGDPEFPTSRCPCQCQDFYYSWMPEDDWFCANAERRTDV